MTDTRKRRVVIDDGTREITLVNKYQQEICKLHIRTGDYSLMERYNKFLEDLPTIVKPAADIDIKADGTNDSDTGWKILKQIETELINRLSEFFDTTEVRQIFEKRNAFSSVGGRFFVENVLESLGQEMAETIAEESKASMARMNKYLTDIDGDSDAGETAE